MNAPLPTIGAPLVTETAPATVSRGYWATVFARVLRDKMTVVCALILLALVILAVFAPWFSPKDPLATSMLKRLAPVGSDGYLLGGSILVETVFAWPGTGFLLNTAIFQRDLPLLQGTILFLALFFVLLNLIVDVAQGLFDPRIKR